MAHRFIHYLDPKFLAARKISANVAKSMFENTRSEFTFTFYKLNPSFESIAGLPAYSRAAVSNEDHIFFISDSYKHVDTEGLMMVSYDLLTLNVPLEDKNKARDKGAVWHAPLNKWCCDPDRQESFQKWVDNSSALIQPFTY